MQDTEGVEKTGEKDQDGAVKKKERHDSIDQGSGRNTHVSVWSETQSIRRKGTRELSTPNASQLTCKEKKKRPSLVDKKKTKRGEGRR